MPENPSNTPDPNAVPDKTPKARAEQDQKIANAISEAFELLEVAQADPEIGLLMAAKGYDAAELQKGVGLQAAAQDTFNDRQQAMAKSASAGDAFDAAEQTARQTYADFRETARIKFSGAADRSALGLVGAVPRDLQKFITTATASYKAAQGAAYAAVLAKAGFKAADTTAELGAVKALGELHSKFDTAGGGAEAATDARDAAHDAMAKWVSEYRRLAKIALRGKPGLLAKVKV